MPGCQAGCSHHRVADRVAQTCERVGVRLPRLGNDSDVLGSALGIEDPEGDHAPLAYTGDRVGGILDVVRRVLHAADHDHVLAPSDEEEIRSGKVGTISRVEPPVDERLSGPRWIVMVPGEEAIAPQPDLAHLTLAKGSAGRIADLDRVAG